jgi:hypothetical protein
MPRRAAAGWVVYLAFVVAALSVPLMVKLGR